MTVRLWYPQLDIYDSIRRMATILIKWKTPSASPERLCIFDFYLANSPLLHLTHMPSHVRKVFSALGITRPEKAFVSYPSPPVLFNKMQPVQAEALKTMVGKGLIDPDAYGRGQIVLAPAGRELFAGELASLSTEEEQLILSFLVEQFSQIGQTDITDLRRATGLRLAAST